MVIDQNVATAVKNFLENYAEIHGLPSPGRSVNRITQLITYLPAETTYKSVYQKFLTDLEEDSNLKSENRRDLDNSYDHNGARAGADEAPPQSVSRETLVRQAARSAIADFAFSTAGRPETPAPTIQVSIGRVEVRAVTPPAPTPRIVEKKAPPLLSLDQYLRQRNEGRR